METKKGRKFLFWKHWFTSVTRLGDYIKYMAFMDLGLKSTPLLLYITLNCWLSRFQILGFLKNRKILNFEKRNTSYDLKLYLQIFSIHVLPNLPKYSQFSLVVRKSAFKLWISISDLYRFRDLDRVKRCRFYMLEGQIYPLLHQNSDWN